jgi:hypothetical protein
VAGVAQPQLVETLVDLWQVAVALEHHRQSVVQVCFMQAAVVEEHFQVVRQDQEEVVLVVLEILQQHQQ